MMIPKEIANEFRETLLSGQYNILVGSGVSIDSRNAKGDLLRSAETLRKELCNLTSARENTTLQRVSSLLTPDQIQSELVNAYKNCTPGPSLKKLSTFLWRRIFSFNIDDVIEKHYHNEDQKKQKLFSINFDELFEPTPIRDTLQLIHLHGSVIFPGNKFVFSATEYARIMNSLNPWMHLLAEIIATEPFVIAGTSLNEPDLEYYLSYRSEFTPRRGSGPSLLIEPYPDVVTESDCKRFGLQLVPHTFGDFLNWMDKEFMHRPTIYDLVVPDYKTIFSEYLAPKQLLTLFSEAEIVAYNDRPKPAAPPAFLYGREPDWDDIHAHVGISRKDSTDILVEVKRSFASDVVERNKIILVVDTAGSGKTTIIKEVAHQLARIGIPVISVKTLSKISVHNFINCLKEAKNRVVLLVDAFADHVDQIVEILDDDAAAKNVVVLAAEREYRLEFLDVMLGGLQRETKVLNHLSRTERLQLLGLYRQYGLIADETAIKFPERFASKITKDPIAIAVCRILNDFKPLDVIVKSLWDAADKNSQFLYLCISLAQHCFWAGLRYSHLQAIEGPKKGISILFDPQNPLKATFHPVDKEFVIATNPIIAERILSLAEKTEQELLFQAFKKIAIVLAPHVNRKAIIRRSPESRLAGRLFDADKIVRPLLWNKAEQFYVEAQKQWEWNSRYWEQRALLAASHDIDVAVQYGRHAIGIERHPYPLTTLGKLLFIKMEQSNVGKEGNFREALRFLDEAVKIESQWMRRTVHPFITALNGIIKYLQSGGKILGKDAEQVELFKRIASLNFPNDPNISTAIDTLSVIMS